MKKLALVALAALSLSTAAVASPITGAVVSMAMASDPAIDSLGTIATSSISNTKGPLLAVFAVILGVTVLFFAYRKIKGAAGGR